MPRPFAQIGQSVGSFAIANGSGYVAFPSALGLVENGQQSDRSGASRHVATHTLIHVATIAVSRTATTIGWFPSKQEWTFFSVMKTEEWFWNITYLVMQAQYSMQSHPIGLCSSSCWSTEFCWPFATVTTTANKRSQHFQSARPIFSEPLDSSVILHGVQKGSKKKRESRENDEIRNRILRIRVSTPILSIDSNLNRISWHCRIFIFVLSTFE